MTILYMVVIIRLIIFKYPLEHMEMIMRYWSPENIRGGVLSANFELFKTIKMYIHYYARLNSFENLFGNILIFVPFGFLIPHAMEKMKYFLWIFLFSFCFIVDIELFQLVTRFGEFDVDDILLNMTGVIVGWGIFHLIAYLKKGWQERKNNGKRKSQTL